MSYTAIHIKGIDKEKRDELSALLFTSGALGFEEKEDEIVAYFDFREDLIPEIEQKLAKSGFSAGYILKERIVKNENWNENWKEYFKPQEIGRFCVHPPWEDCSDALLPLVISPKMAFGTGTHETTRLMLEYLSENIIDGKRILDAGCGSGILSIAARKLGAAEVTAFDIDPLALENSRENISLNRVENIFLIQGDINLVSEKDFDLLLANINAEILLKTAEKFADKVKFGGKIILSGLLLSDREKIIAAYKSYRMVHWDSREMGEWALLEFVKG
jgi:ribosomal protein L11 methyltransferase